MFQTASELLAYANEYLDSIEGRPPKDEEEALQRTMEVKRLISEMRRFNFHAPKFGIKTLFKDIALMEKEELLEAMPFLQEFLYSLNIRQWTYERAKVAYLSNRFAVFVLRESWMDRYLPYLPYGGSYLYFTEKGGGPAYLSFRDIEKILKGESQTTVFFLDEKPVSVERRKGRGPFSKSTATFLSSVVVGTAVGKHMDDILREEKGVVPHYQEVLEYERTVSRYDVQNIGENPEVLWKLLQELEEKGFLDEDGTVKPYLLNGVRRKRMFRYNRLSSLAQSYLSIFLLEYYAYFQPWRNPRHPLRGVPRDKSVKSAVGGVSLPFCRAEAGKVKHVFDLLFLVAGTLPVDRRELAETLLFKVCAPLGKPHESVEKLLEGAERSSDRVSKFLEVLKDDGKSEGQGRPSKTGKERRGNGGVLE